MISLLDIRFCRRKHNHGLMKGQINQKNLLPNTYTYIKLSQFCQILHSIDYLFSNIQCKIAIIKLYHSNEQLHLIKTYYVFQSKPVWKREYDYKRIFQQCIFKSESDVSSLFSYH